MAAIITGFSLLVITGLNLIAPYLIMRLTDILLTDCCESLAEVPLALILWFISAGPVHFFLSLFKSSGGLEAGGRDAGNRL